MATVAPAVAPAMFDPNEDHELSAAIKAGATARFPSFNAIDAAGYASVFSNLPALIDTLGFEKGGDLFPVAKTGSVNGFTSAPEMQTFARISTMPNSFYRGLVQWPDLPAATLKKIANDHLIVHTIIQQRVADILRYAERSSHPWKPGWRVELRQGLRQPDASDLKDIIDAERFIEQCMDGPWDARQRDGLGLTSFQRFLAGTLRDSERFDGMAWWTDMDVQGRVRAFRALPAGNIMLATRDGYQGRK